MSTDGEDKAARQAEDEARGQIAWMYDNNKVPATSYWRKKMMEGVMVVGAGATMGTFALGIGRMAAGGTSSSFLNQRVFLQTGTVISLIALSMAWNAAERWNHRR
eukprot:TRINITY_DN1707_c0_g1_i1.p1 TRINITY_DN1707_c0_g1~~TRINITY_DN1707_c0_g1_i1.p1  ORF type:complete len:105 (-),score=22.72 TRINITY_DN1707_c0_g1_i1:97-411(-)